MKRLPCSAIPALATCLAVALTALSLNLAASGQEKPAPPVPDIVLREALIVPPVGRYGRNPLPTDPIAAQIARSRWAAPQPGDEVQLPDGTTRHWEAIQADKDGNFKHSALSGGYAHWAVPSPEEKVMILHAAGHAMVHVNGEPRVGDVYQTGYVRLPVLLKKGTNDLLFHCLRGSLRARLVAPTAPALLNAGDLLLPDLIVGRKVDVECAIPVLNVGTAPPKGLSIRVEAKGQTPLGGTSPVSAILPFGIRKTSFRLTGPAPESEGTIDAEVLLLAGDGADAAVLDTAKIQLRVLDPHKTHKRTFRSAIDGSLQYYAIVPAKPAAKPGLVLTLHGAGVEAIGQANCYAPKSFAHVVAPTNRRPYGFDWEDWGRLDALEVLARAQAELGTDPRRTYLTGHSMGGHGTWHLGATYPGRFAAIGPSAGWVSFWSYGGLKKAAKPAPPEELVLRCANPSDTAALSRNLAAEPIYVLHGDKDDNVPVSQARAMKKLLEPFHKDFAYHEQPGAGHWWGNDCVDWKPMFEMFEKRTLPAPADVREVEFVTANPGASAWMHWAGIEGQQHAAKFSEVKLRLDADPPRLSGTTTNVSRLAIDVGHLKPAKTLEVELDGQKVEAVGWPANGTRLWLRRDGEKWSAASALPASHKNPDRYGPLRDAFRNHMVFVYGTKGTAEENAWALAKARFDAETFWYRGNGSIPVVADTEYDPSVQSSRDGNVILYGNSQTNGLWKALLADSPVQVGAGRITIGDKTLQGGELACLFLRPRPGSDRTLVGVIGGTGVHGMRLTDRLPLFVSGIGYPDCLVFGPEALAEGLAGVRVAGFFAQDWGVPQGEFAWR
jgi:poly(3-hydroxybutyrate) depolymerase